MLASYTDGHRHRCCCLSSLLASLPVACGPPWSSESKLIDQRVLNSVPTLLRRACDCGAGPAVTGLPVPQKIFEFLSFDYRFQINKLSHARNLYFRKDTIYIYGTSRMRSERSQESLPDKFQPIILVIFSILRFLT